MLGYAYMWTVSKSFDILLWTVYTIAPFNEVLKPARV